MVSRTKRKSRDVRSRTPRLRPVEESNGRAATCATAVSAEALRTGVVPYAGRNRQRTEIPREGETIRAGDPDDRVLANEYAGEETPGVKATWTRSKSTLFGRAHGLRNEARSLRCASEILIRRDRRRSELIPPRRPV
jgi:hypothetical protein